MLVGISAIKYFWFLPVSPFEADQEYLALSGREILKGNLTLLGAPTSVGGMFIAPLYNYLIAGLLVVFRGNPLVVNGLSDFWMTLTIPALYLIGKKFYSEKTGFLASIAALFSINFIDQSEVPPLLSAVPLLSLLVLSVLKSSFPKIKKELLLGTLAGLALNLHFSGVFFLPLLMFVGWAWVIPLLLFVSPLLLFEMRHNFFILQHTIQFVSSAVGSHSTIGYRVDTYMSGISNLLSPLKINKMIVLLIFVSAALLLLRKKKHWEFILLTLPLLFFFIYSGHLLPYYSIISWPIVFILIGIILARAWNYKKIRHFTPLIVLFLLAGYGVQNIERWSRWDSGRSIDKKIAALRYIRDQSNGGPMYLSKTIEPAADFGFTYLIDYVGIDSSGDQNDPNYTIVAPFNWQGIQPDVRFGDFGIVLPKQKGKEIENKK